MSKKRKSRQTRNWGLGTGFAATGGGIALFFFVRYCFLRSSLAHLFDEKVNICLFLAVSFEQSAISRKKTEGKRGSG
jgi:hypothetical protein